eukprot:3930877-Pleurochrysis_carterae.AAC.1
MLRDACVRATRRLARGWTSLHLNMIWQDSGFALNTSSTAMVHLLQVKRHLRPQRASRRVVVNEPGPVHASYGLFSDVTNRHACGDRVRRGAGGKKAYAVLLSKGD